MSSNCFILLLAILTSLSSAQQPTPFIPAHTEPTTVTTTLIATSLPSSTIIDNSTTSRPRDFYPTYDRTIRIPTLRDASAILQALTSAQSTWTAGTAYPSITAAVYAAAPPPAQLSLSHSGYSWDKIVQAPWYTALPPPYQSLVAQQEDALQDIFDRLSQSSIAKPGSISSAGRVAAGGWRRRRGGDGRGLAGGVCVGGVVGVIVGVLLGVL